MKLTDVKLSTVVAGAPGEVFDAWFDPQRAGGPWHGAEKVIMNFAVGGMFYFGIDRERWIRHMLRDHGVRVPPGRGDALFGTFGRFVAIDRPRAVEHTWISETTYGIETSVWVTFEPRDSGTQVTILHGGVPDDERGRVHEGGWNFLLSRLASEFDARIP